MSFPIDQIRARTPGCHDKIFVNSAGASLVSSSLIEISKKYLDQEADIGGYDVMANHYDAFSEFYKEAANLIGAKARNMAFAISATDAYSKVLYSFDWKPSDVILTTKDDYVSNIISFIHIHRRYGTSIEFVDTTEQGDIDYDDLRIKLDRFQPTLFALTHIPTSAGTIHDAERAGAICAESDCYYLLDACQSIGQIEVNVEKIQCDFLTVTGRKFLRGPRGTGFLYVSDQILDQNMGPLCIDLAGSVWNEETSFEFGPEAKRFEYWEKNYSNFFGLTQAIREINEIGIREIERYNTTLSQYYRSALTEIEGLKIYDHGSRKGNIITWKIAGYSQQEIAEYFSKHRVFYSFSNKSSALYDMNRKGEEWVVRFSPHYFNTMEEGDRLQEIIAGLPKK